MVIFSIDPNTGNYFKSKEDISVDTLYQGIYNYTPVYPRYTFNTSGRFNYTHTNPEIKFYTMIPIKRLFVKYLVEVTHTFIINPYQEKSLEKCIEMFHEFCKENIKKLDIKNLK